jgi:hypothetical protein
MIYCDDECVAVGGIKIGKGNRSTRENLPQCHFVHQGNMLLPSELSIEAGEFMFLQNIGNLPDYTTSRLVIHRRGNLASDTICSLDDRSLGTSLNWMAML